MTVTGDEIGELLRRLELALARRTDPGVPGGLAGLIADDFVEFGASGRRWDAASIRELLASSGVQAQLRLEDLETTRLAPDVVLVTYRIGPPSPSLRSSVWLRRDGRWQLRFHQGTPRGTSA